MGVHEYLLKDKKFFEEQFCLWWRMEVFSHSLVRKSLIGCCKHLERRRKWVMLFVSTNSIPAYYSLTSHFFLSFTMIGKRKSFLTERSEVLAKAPDITESWGQCEGEDVASWHALWSVLPASSPPSPPTSHTSYVSASAALITTTAMSLLLYKYSYCPHHHCFL